MSEARTDSSEQLARERRYAPYAAAAAAVGAIATVAAIVAVASAGIGRSTADRARLLDYDGARAELLVSTFFQVLAVAGTVAALVYLLAAAARRVPGVPRWTLVLVLAAGLLLAVGTSWRQLDILGIAHDFAAGTPTRGAAGERRADDLVADLPTLPLALAFVGTLLIAASIVFANVVAMRAGLVSRFLGIVGIIVGALHVLPLAGGPQILQVFWLGALALLFLDRWPGGRGPAWSSGQAEPWPVPQRR